MPKSTTPGHGPMPSTCMNAPLSTVHPWSKSHPFHCHASHFHSHRYAGDCATTMVQFGAWEGGVLGWTLVHARGWRTTTPCTGSDRALLRSCRGRLRVRTKEMYVTSGLDSSRPCLNSVLAGTILLDEDSRFFCHRPGQNLKASQIFPLANPRTKPHHITP